MAPPDEENSGERPGSPDVPEDTKQALDRVTDAFFVLNSDWEFTYLNSRATELLDPSQTGLVGKNIWEEFSEATDLRFNKEYRRAVETQSPVEFEEYFPPMDTWFYVHAYPSETGLSVYFRDITDDKKYKNRLKTIHETTRDLMRSETADKIATTTVDCANSVLGFSDVALYLWDEETGVLRPGDATESITARYDHGLPTLGGGESMMWDVFISGEMRTFDESPPRQEMYNPDSSIQTRVFIPLSDHGVILAATESNDGTVEDYIELLEILTANVEAALDRVKREREFIEKQEDLEHTNEQLSEVNRITKTIRKVDKALVQSTHRREVEAAVCDALTDAGAYRLAWFGAVDPQTDALTMNTSSGEDSMFIDQLLTADRDSDPLVPAERAVQTGEPVFTENVLTGFPETKWREETLNAGYRSLVSLPIQFRETTYGVLEVYAAYPDSFSDKERSVLRELSNTIGNAINAIQRKEALLANSHLELTIEIPSSNGVFTHTAAKADCELRVESLLPRADGNWLVYFVASNSDPETVVEALQEFPTVESIERMRSSNGGELFGLVLTELSGLSFLGEQGATITALTATSTEAEITLELPQSTDVRSFMETCEANHPNAELLSRKEVADENTDSLNKQVIGELTDPQHRALKVALEGGFFEWPRDKTGEEIAESLGVSPPTFHRHLRIALETVVSSVLD
ncbi:bacterio-opsin activator domain-containing protein [Halobacterium zhouii]|uniref:bacterio-opsin activator domain-containing protein n=1 Tax=Halobacterium zhouii TaxID=2902624 RepID=UPI0022B7B114|nr:bacterio-opsin activator domain-containing protein [Halobacterium zhouii]